MLLYRSIDPILLMRWSSTWSRTLFPHSRAVLSSCEISTPPVLFKESVWLFAALACCNSTSGLDVNTVRTSVYQCRFVPMNIWLLHNMPPIISGEQRVFRTVLDGEAHLFIPSSSYQGMTRHGTAQLLLLHNSRDMTGRISGISYCQ